MKRAILLLIFLTGFLYSGKLKSECANCRKLNDELRKSEDFSMKIMRELRATIKELNTASAQIRKFQSNF